MYINIQPSIFSFLELTEEGLNCKPEGSMERFWILFYSYDVRILWLLSWTLSLSYLAILIHINIYFAYHICFIALYFILFYFHLISSSLIHKLLNHFVFSWSKFLLLFAVVSLCFDDLTNVFYIFYKISLIPTTMQIKSYWCHAVTFSKIRNNLILCQVFYESIDSFFSIFRGKYKDVFI